MKLHEDCENLKVLRETADTFGLIKLLALPRGVEATLPA